MRIFFNTYNPHPGKIESSLTVGVGVGVGVGVEKAAGVAVADNRPTIQRRNFRQAAYRSARLTSSSASSQIPPP